jgi:hypothetical protein
MECCEIIFNKFLNETKLKHFLRTLDGRIHVNDFKRLIERGKFDVNQRVTFKYGNDVYTCTPLTIAIIYHAFTDKSTTACIQVRRVGDENYSQKAVRSLNKYLSLLDYCKLSNSHHHLMLIDKSADVTSTIECNDQLALSPIHCAIRLVAHQRTVSFILLTQVPRYGLFENTARCWRQTK